MMGSMGPLIHEAVAYHAFARGDHTALRAGTRTVSYAALGESMGAAGGFLRKEGARRIGLLLGNTVEHLQTLLGAAAAGVTVAPLHPGWDNDHLAAVMAMLDLDVIVTDADGQQRLADTSMNSVPIVVTEQVLEGPASMCPNDVDPEAWQLLSATGGTSGQQKAVAISHRASSARAIAQILAYGIGPPSTFAVFTPLFHGAARGASVAHLMAGGAVKIFDGFNPRTFAAGVADATSTFCVPTMLAKLLAAGVADLHPGLQIVVSGSSLDSDLAAMSMRQLGCQLMNYYASVDAGGITAGPADIRSQRITSVGRPFLGTRVEIVDDHGRSLPAGDIGRVVVRSPSVASAIINGQHEFRLNGQLVTSDLGRMSEGHLFLLGRTDDVIISGGVNIAPEVVEAALKRHPSIHDVVVVGVPDPVWGQSVAALVVIDDLPLEALKHWVRDHLSPAQRPRHLHRTDVIPLTALGKPDRRRASNILEKRL